ncbi:hypothetical protein N7535_006038 [Penicillium sp. DV-2018c]|nr:hypothetical protein N7535_006038 [Penicillium sp. DV-2018c]
MPPPPVLSGLTSVSLRVFDLVVEQFHDPPFARPDLLLLDIDGKAGTGKCHPIPPLSATSARMASEAGAKAFYGTFDRTLELDNVMRQQGSNDLSVCSRGMPDRLCEESISRVDLELLASRVQGIDLGRARRFC